MAAGVGEGAEDDRQTWQAAEYLSTKGQGREGVGKGRGIVETEIIKTLNELHNSQIHFRPAKDTQGCRINLYVVWHYEFQKGSKATSSIRSVAQIPFCLLPPPSCALNSSGN